MGSLSLWHWIVVIAVVVLLFGGRGKISELMGDFAKGIKSFKKGLSEDEAAADPATHQQARAIEGNELPSDLKQRAESERRVEGTMT